MAHYKFHNDCQSSVLTYEQVKRLDHVMDQVVPIHGRGNAPTLFVKLKELIRLVKHKLQNEHSIEIRDVRLNGSGASYVLAPENSQYNDLDIIFGTDLSNGDRFDVIRDVVLECLMEFHPDNINKRQRDQSGVSSSVDNHGVSIDCDGRSDLDPELSGDSVRMRGEIVSHRSPRSERSLSIGSDNFNVTVNDSESGKSDVEDDDNNESMRINDSGVDILSNSSNGAERDESKFDSRSEVSLQESIRCSSKSSESTGRQQQRSLGPTTTTISQQANQYQYQMPPNNCAIKEAYVHKMVKVNDDDRWSLISLGVQQSEANNCCGQMHHEHTTVTNYGGLMTYTSVPAGGEQSSASKSSIEHQKQFPNSIELKFVDRMRRKFEFSVDSFQIILDTLTQFYDYVPQSTITIQRKMSNSNLSSKMIDTARPVRNNEACSRCSNNKQILFDHNTTLKGSLDGNSDQLMLHGSRKTQTIRSLPVGSGDGGNVKQVKNPTGGSTRGLYELSLDQGASLVSYPSVASSSGCSSSSSVVSSSSSLSYDEDQEDLCCEVENNPPSSSASTSSLLSSTTISTQSTNSGQDNSLQLQGKIPYCNKSTKSSQVRSKLTMAALDGIISAPEITKKALDNKVKNNDCTECFDNDHEQNSNSNCNDSMQQCNSLIRRNMCDYGTNRTSCAVISENFYPTVIGRSEYGNFKEALYHLEKKLIATRSPEEIRGGGLLKYCNLLVKNYKPTNVYQIRTLERYMCSRFFIDFSDLNQQRAKLESYLANHFSDDPIQKFDYLTILHNVVQRSTVCLMNHELRLTLNMIRELAYSLNEQQIQSRQQHAQIQDHLQQQQQAIPAQSQNSSSDQAQTKEMATLEQNYYQPFTANQSKSVGPANIANPKLAKT